MRDLLTEREQEILALVRAGLSNRAIAERLGVSKNAVRFHLKELHSKLDTNGDRKRLHLSDFARSLGWLAALGPKVAAPVMMAGMVAAVVGGSLLAWHAHPAAPGVDASEEGEMDWYYAWEGATLADFATLGRISIAELEMLNPGLGLVPLSSDTKVWVPVPLGRTSALATLKR